jgi:prevent-host-death family protein
MKNVSAGDANRHFSSLLRDVATGQVVTVLSRGKPVATISPPRVPIVEKVRLPSATC